MTFVTSAALGPVRHGFFGRAAGDCGLGSGQDAATAAANRRRAADAILPGAPLATLYQVHSPTAVIVTEAVADDQPQDVGARAAIVVLILYAPLARIFNFSLEAALVSLVTFFFLTMMAEPLLLEYDR